MSEVNGTTVIIQKDGAEIIGQMDMTVTHNGAPIPTTNKSGGGWDTFLDGELGTKGVVIAGSIVYNNTIVQQQMLTDAFAGTQAVYSFTYPNTGEAFSGSFVPHARADSLTQSTAVNVAISFTASGEVTRTPATAPADPA